MAAQQNAPASTAWGRCLACGAEGHLDTRTGLCAACQQRMPPAAAPPAAPHGQPAQPYAYPYPQPGLLPGPYPNPAPGANPGPYSYPYYYQYPYPNPYPNPYSNPYSWSYPYPTKSPQQQSAETRATLGAVLCLIGLTIVFPFGFITAPMAAIGLVLCYSAYRRGVQWALWGMVFAIAVLVLGILGVVALFTIPPIW